MDVQFLETVFNDSIQHPNFFNGRILTAADLRDEQAANLKRARYLGQAVGEGVAYGLNVTISEDGTALDISGGLAVNRRGDGLYLPGEKITVKLLIRERLTPTSTSPFVPCDITTITPLTGGSPTDFYILAITSATRPSKLLAPHSGLNGDHSCTNRYEEVGVQFKLIPLSTTDTKGATDRSTLAHLCFGTQALIAQAASPFEMPTHYGLIDDFREDNRLTACDVSLALFEFKDKAAQFVDVWAVRRPCLPALRPAGFPTERDTWLNEVLFHYVSDRRLIEAKAFLLQFQNHLEDIRTGSGINPPTEAAATHFEYLPAAGYLPVQTGDTGERFRPAYFFGREISPLPLDPANLRTIFHESFYEQPLVPGEDAVDVYEVLGSPPDDPYVIFVRRTSTVEIDTVEEPVVEAPGDGAPEDDTPAGDGPAPRPTVGDLSVTILAEGSSTPLSLITGVQATYRRTGRVYNLKPITVSIAGYRGRSYRSFLESTIDEIKTKYDYFDVSVLGSSIYAYEGLPTGDYTVKAILTPTAARLYYSSAETVTVRANSNTNATVMIHELELIPPRETAPCVSEEFLLGHGIVIKGGCLYPSWEDEIPEWQGPLPGIDRGDIDPGPDYWGIVVNPEFAHRIETQLGRYPPADPRVVNVDPEVYVSVTYDPTRPASQVYAFVQTQDGARFPLVLLAADNALDKSVSVERTELPDFDRATMNRLESAGLADLTVFASAPTPLLAAVVGKDLAYTESLVGEVQSVLQEGFRNGFMGYVGIGLEESNAIKEAMGVTEGRIDRTEFANTDPETIMTWLGVSEAYAERLLKDVQSTLPAGSYDLSGTGISAEGQQRLAEQGIKTNKQFRDANRENRDLLLTTLGVSGATLDRYLEEATLDYARAQFLSEPDKSIGTLDFMTPEAAAKLAAEGVGSAKMLANSDPGVLAEHTGLAEGEITDLINNAVEYGSNAHLTLVESVISTGDARAIIGAGYRSPGAIVRADESDLTVVGLDSDTASNIQRVTGRLLTDRGGVL